MQIHPLLETSAAQTGATHLGIITFADLTTAGNTQSLNLAPVGIGTGAALVFALLKTPFTSSDGTLVSLAVTLGDTGSANRYLTSYELLATPAKVKGGVALNPGLNVFAAADNLIAAFTATAAKLLTTMTAGEIHFYIKLVNP